jgi:hypothetical protein
MSRRSWSSFAAAVALLALAPRGSAQTPPATTSETPELAARALETTLTWVEFDQLVTDRHAMSDMGRAALKHLMRARLLDRLAGESKLSVTDADVERRAQELEREMAASGEAKTLDDYLTKNRVTPSKFREFLRLAIVQETLARRALGIPSDRPINGEQQEMWLDQIVEQRGAQMLAPPWKDGVAARCGEIQVSARDFLLHLRQQLDVADVRDDCYQALLAKRMRARMPDLSNEAFQRALDAELARRRAAVESDPQYKGLQFEQMMAAQGLSTEALRRDPAIGASALAHVWVDRTHDEAGLRRVYADERSRFDQLHGEAFETRVIFQRAAVLTNQLNPRSFEQAEIEIAKIAAQIKSRADFEKLAKQRSEDSASRDKGGLIGWVAAGDENVPDRLRAAIFDGAQNASERMVGPVHLSTGVALVWVGQRRPPPPWDEMAGYVHEELRRRFMDECLQRKDVVTFLDEE